MHDINTIYKATDEGALDLNLIVTEPVPNLDNLHLNFEEYCKIFFRQQAELLYQMLHASLPQGTMDHLFAIFAREKASIFKVLS